MKIDPELLEKALTQSTEEGLAETDEVINHNIHVLSESKRIRVGVVKSVVENTSPNDQAAGYGTMYQMGFNAGYKYRELEEKVGQVPTKAAGN